ncbi:hypothetical protein UNPF46_01765 [Bradyrhizobium sp. UNPF46]|uniref:hypothetical protein n=1 Tax=Bradyrhizobium sp. UNPF46 TaxID=1141168 RepID=UPI001154064A|nr:hypothetical protein [Bradyrhizobium sp. UNPF46]TQF43349.1 hypothetical protein UNPF46_01765 [Bradyrhizobium sp. UNPF46]
MEFLRNRAKTFVVLGWVFFAVSIPICLSISVGAGISRFYFPTHPGATLNAFDARASNLVLVAGALAAVASSIALALKFRATASLLVLVTWGAAVAGTQVARSFVKPGPEYFERHVGSEVFFVPWQYVPAGPGASVREISNENGFSAALCLPSLKGRAENDCTFIRQLSVLPDGESIADFDLENWRKHRIEMSPGPDRSGYQSFSLSYTAQPGGPTRIQHYLARLNPDGQLTRLVVCRLEDEKSCRHHALVGKYWLGYDAGLSEADDALDRKLAALIELWRRK